MLEVALDKRDYAPGDTMTVAVTARSAGRLTLNVIGDRLLASQTTDVQPGVAQVEASGRQRLGHRRLSGRDLAPAARRAGAADAGPRHRRAMVLDRSRAQKRSASSSNAPALLRPNSSLHIPVKVAGLAAGEEARIVVAAVDVGILNLTNYKPPSPDDYYLGQHALSAEIRDLYGNLIDGMQGTRGADPQRRRRRRASCRAARRRGPPVALYSGIVKVGADGTAEVAFDMPTLPARSASWRWPGARTRSATPATDVTVRDPVVLSATLPRFLLPGDRSTVHLDLDNVEGQAGDYTIAVTSADAALRRNATQKLTLRAKERGAANVPLTATCRGRRHRAR